MFNISVNDKKNIYRSKPVMNVDTVPKPLTYDYMPEGYPSKSVGTVTLMEEQEVAFGGTDSGLMEAVSPVALAIEPRDKLTVVWDGVSYDVAVKERVTPGPGGNMVEIMFGNLALINRGESEDYPFVCAGVSAPVDEFFWIAEDTATSHTIKVMRPTVKYTPIDVNYMPEGYPKKDGWSVEWDGNIEGKTSAVGAPIYKFSDMVLSYEEFLSAKVVIYDGGEQYSGMVSDEEPQQTQITDAVSIFGIHSLSFIVVSEDNAEAEGIIFPTKGLYTSEGPTQPFKLIKETITPMSTDFLPKNFNVVFSGINSTRPDSCNVTYDELRGWIEKGVPVFAIYQYKQDDGSVSSVANVMNVVINTDSLSVYYRDFLGTHNFTYNSDGTFSEGEG